MQNSSFLKLNKLLAYLITIWICCPLVSQKTGMMTGAILSILWILTAIICNRVIKLDRIGICILIYALFMLASYLVNQRVYASFDPVAFLAYVCLFFLSFFIFDFYSENDLGTLRYIFYICLISLSVGCVISISYSKIIPGIMKSVDMINNNTADAYRTVGIGTFGFVYLLLITVIACFQWLVYLKNIKLKVIYIAFIVLGTYTIIASTYTAALIMLVMGFTFILLFRKTRKISPSFILLILFGMVVFLLLKNVVGNYLISVTLSSDEMTTRLNEVGQYLVQGNQGYNVAMRMDKFVASWESFIDNFLLGYNFGGTSSVAPGGHTQLLDTFAIYGIFCGTAIYILIITMLKRTFLFEKNYGSNFRFIIVPILLVYSVVEPLLYVYQVGFAIFLVSACSLMAVKEANNNGPIEDS